MARYILPIYCFRYMAIVHPLRPRLTAKIVLAIIFLIWLASVIIALPMIIYAEIQTYIMENGDSRTVCLIVWPDGVLNTTDFV